MKYPPPHHQDNSRDHMIEVIKQYPLATIISVKDNEPIITHLPLIYRKDGKLIGHIDIYNPQAELLQNNHPITVIFQGPQCYISPTVYGTTQLPTWNYIRVHLKGSVEKIENREALRLSLIKMTEFLEAPDNKYVLEPDNTQMEKALDYIKMFEISISEWEGKFKLSQDKSRSDIEKARDELINKEKESIRDFLDRVFRQQGL